MNANRFVSEAAKMQNASHRTDVNAMKIIDLEMDLPAIVNQYAKYSVNMANVLRRTNASAMMAIGLELGRSMDVSRCASQNVKMDFALNRTSASAKMAMKKSTTKVINISVVLFAELVKIVRMVVHPQTFAIDLNSLDYQLQIII